MQRGVGLVLHDHALTLAPPSTLPPPFPYLRRYVTGVVFAVVVVVVVLAGFAVVVVFVGFVVVVALVVLFDVLV